MAPFATTYSWPTDPRVARVQAIGKLGGLEIVSHPDFQMGVTNKSEEFLAKFPLGKIPVMETADGFCIAESAAMAYYAAAAGNLADQLLGTDAKTKGKIMEWAFFADTELLANCMPVFVMCVIKLYPADENRYKSCVASVERALGKVEVTLAKGNGKYLVGDKLTYADFMVFAPLFFAAGSLLDAEMRKSAPTVVKYLENLAAIPEIKETFGELKFAEKRPCSCEMPQNPTGARGGSSLKDNCLVRSYLDFKACGKKVRDGLKRESKVLCEHLKPSQATLYRVPTFECTNFQDDGSLFEEESHRNFARGDFYPVQLGQMIKGTSYQTLVKLGWGESSTAWMAFDLRSETFVALKICTRLSPESDRQEDCQRRMSIHANPKHPGYPFINHTRPVEPIRRPGGPTSKPSADLIPSDERHACLVQKLMWRYWATVCSSACWRNHHLRRGARQLLLALDYLNTECGLVHGNICEAHVGYRVPLNETVVRETLGLVRRPQSRTTAARPYVKTVTARDCTDFTLYRSTPFDEDKLGNTTNFSKVLLGSFGQARVAYEVWDPEGTPKSMYTAPEILLGLEVTFAADVWSLGLMLWKMWRREYLINGSLGCDDDDPLLHWDSTSHMASIVSRIGPPPMEMLERGRFSSRYFTPEGALRMECTNHKHELKLKNDSFEDLIWSMVRWRPEDRKTPKQLLDHPWLNEEL
ncbi:uncharacterized protein PpBr36_09285 [Pyricularia pennisetigena]|uniref:uncharacterized protein n=1 Tax=Pyricularia pennisetigena TaxID=1578925 RepID=UPI00114F4F9E|nr:uncharacterized protein PpBr36_09285 [Pyricularia pennisetigena]TLS21748.1 hypothetical protein PpBr36_09285 [Pyricularia pennisetigena]